MRRRVPLAPVVRVPADLLVGPRNLDVWAPAETARLAELDGDDRADAARSVSTAAYLAYLTGIRQWAVSEGIPTREASELVKAARGIDPRASLMGGGLDRALSGKRVANALVESVVNVRLNDPRAAADALKLCAGRGRVVAHG
jgi:hypothetical protein